MLKCYIAPYMVDAIKELKLKKELLTKKNELKDNENYHIVLNLNELIIGDIKNDCCHIIIPAYQNAKGYAIQTTYGGK